VVKAKESVYQDADLDKDLRLVFLERTYV